MALRSLQPAIVDFHDLLHKYLHLLPEPSSNGLMDLFAEFKCLDMGERLGRFISQYRVNYFVPDQTNGQIVYSYRLRKGAEEQIYNKISDITNQAFQKESSFQITFS